jgi:hypothetical protein
MKMINRILFLFAFTPSIADAQGTYATGGIKLVANGPVNLVIDNGAFSNSGAFTAGQSTVSFTGTAPTANSFIGGASATVFYDLLLNKSSNDLQLNNNISVSNHLTLSSGLFQLNNQVINLGNTGLLVGESNSSRVTGTTGGLITATATLNGSVNANPGNLGMIITSAANLGITVVSRGHKQPISLTNGIGIYRYYDLTPANNAGLDATITFNYFDGELGPIVENELIMWISSDGGMVWNPVGNGGDVKDRVSNFILKNNVDLFYRFTLGSNITSPLPIKLLSFTGYLKDETARLNWETAEEVNSDHFELQRADISGNFKTIAIIKAQGNSNIKHEYSYIDTHPYEGVTLYRLKEVDKDNKFDYSGIVKIQSIGKAQELMVYPNPTEGNVYVQLYSDQEKELLLIFSDQSGRFVKQQVAHCQKGLNTIQLNIQNLAAGTYYMNASGQIVKLVKQ